MREVAAVPSSKIPAMIRFSDEIARQFDLAMGAFGHAGDGNLHPIIRADKNIANPGKIRGD